MLDLIANKFFKGNKNIAFMVCAITGLILIIILIVIIANMFSGGIKSYKDLENELVSSAEKYYKDNSDKLPTTDGAMVSVSDSTLVENGYIKELKKLYSKDTCSATVEVIKSGDDYLYNPILKCEEYTTKTLFDELTSNVVSEGSGL